MVQPYLTKSRYLAGLQCQLRLWKQIHTPMPFAELVPGTPQYEGTRIGELARRRFPDGVLVENKAYDHLGAVDRTAQLMADGCPAIFEGAFEHDGRRVRVDVLRRVGDGRWALYEVKSSTSIHPEHYDDVAFQTDVVRRAGVTVSASHVVHLDRDYRRSAQGIDVDRLFRFVDVSEEIGTYVEEIGPRIERMTAVIQADNAPAMQVGLHCWKPHDCEFLEQCMAGFPADWVGNLPRVSQGQLDQLAAVGVTRIGDIPETLNLRNLQLIVRDSHRSGKPFVSPSMREDLESLAPPAAYLDFESIMPGVPLYTDTAPYQQIPFLFSLHKTDAAGLSHSDFIAPPGPDPRRSLAEELIAQSSATVGPIIVYSAYEKRIIGELSVAFPDLAAALTTIKNRLQDLLGIVRKSVYFSEFNGSFSIKAVGPVLAPDITYSDLEINNGSTAAVAYQGLVEQQDQIEATRTLFALRAYCERDTLAMVRVHAILSELAQAPTLNEEAR